MWANISSASVYIAPGNSGLCGPVRAQGRITNELGIRSWNIFRSELVFCSVVCRQAEMERFKELL